MIDSCLHTPQGMLVEPHPDGTQSLYHTQSQHYVGLGVHAINSERPPLLLSYQAVLPFCLFFSNVSPLTDTMLFLGFFPI